MTREFAPRLDILPPAQLRLWGEMVDVPETFTLYGGTALALHFGHRESIDFDLFGTQSFDPASLIKRIPFLAEADVIQLEADTLTMRVDRGGAVLVSFFGVPEIGRIEEPCAAADNGLKVAGLLDLAGMKASVVQKRATAKDYLDIAALIDHGVDLPTALAAGQFIYGRSFNPQITLKALAYFEDGDLGTLPAAVRRTLQDAVAAVDLNALPTLVVSVHPQGRKPDVNT
jgi:Nucleotidyl transferase AbiEii toxin, Type IV TA system